MRYFAWEIDADVTATVTTDLGFDSRLLTPYLDIRMNNVPVQLVRVTQRTRGDLPLGDFLYGGGDYPRILSVRAARALKEFLEGCGTLTPIVVDGMTEAYLAFTPIVVRDILDEESSLIKESPAGRFLVKARFRENCPGDVQVFLVKGFEQQHIYVSSEFVERVSECGLTGGSFL